MTKSPACRPPGSPFDFAGRLCRLGASRRLVAGIVGLQVVRVCEDAETGALRLLDLAAQSPRHGARALRALLRRRGIADPALLGLRGRARGAAGRRGRGAGVGCAWLEDGLRARKNARNGHALQMLLGGEALAGTHVVHHGAQLRAADPRAVHRGAAGAGPVLRPELEVHRHRQRAGGHVQGIRLRQDPLQVALIRVDHVLHLALSVISPATLQLRGREVGPGEGARARELGEA
mmetsp:Transcript_67943/g.172490  ORF Transcript_67943/g.172490 Transcript_67943/m.172490 type:complete len:234 (-) Transcript_67943:833-1534(-)